jgi:hypothetical protein
MSSEQIKKKPLEIVSSDIFLALNNAQKQKSQKVDINTLMAKVRENEKKQKNENLVFVCLVGAVVVVTGLVASL